MSRAQTDNAGVAVGRSVDDVTRLRHLVEAQRLIGAADLSRDALMQLAAERAQAVTAADGAAVEAVEGDDMVYRAASGMAADWLGLRLAVTQSFSGRCARLGVPMRCVDAAYDARVDREACRRIGIRSMVVVPVTDADGSVAVLKVVGAEPDRFSEPDVEALQELGRLVSDRLVTGAP